MWLVISSRDPTSCSVFNTGFVCKHRIAVPPPPRCSIYRKKLLLLLVTGGCFFNAAMIRRQSGAFVCSDESCTAVSRILQFKTRQDFFFVGSFPSRVQTVTSQRDLSFSVCISVWQLNCLHQLIFVFYRAVIAGSREKLSWYFIYSLACLWTEW